jgi:hypothetical protein
VRIDGDHARDDAVRMSNDTEAQPAFIIEHLTEAQRDQALADAEHVASFLKGLRLPKITPLDGDADLPPHETTKRITTAVQHAFAVNRFMSELASELHIVVVEPDVVET